MVQSGEILITSLFQVMNSLHRPCTFTIATPTMQSTDSPALTLHNDTIKRVQARDWSLIGDEHNGIRVISLELLNSSPVFDIDLFSPSNDVFPTDVWVHGTHAHDGKTDLRRRKKDTR